MARRCGAKHIYNSKYINQQILGAIFQVTICKNGTPLWSTFASQNVQTTTFSEPFFKLRSAKMAHRCEAHLQVKMHKPPHSRSHFSNCDLQKWHTAMKHICMSKCTNHHIPGAIFQVAICKNVTPLWRKIHLQVKMLKIPQCGTDFYSSDREKSCTAVTRSTFASQNIKKLTGTDHFSSFLCPKIARRCGGKHIKIYKIHVFWQTFGP